MTALPPPDRTPSEAQTLFSKLEHHFPTSTLGPDRWYLVATSALTASTQSHHVSTLYLHLTAQPRYATPEARKALVRRMREALVKEVAIVGVPKCLEAVFGIAGVEREEDREGSFSREHWKSGEENHKRGVEWLDRIYLHNRTGTVSALAAHRDFAWISTDITYGLYLSDHSILDAIDTELVVLSGIMTQNLAKETGWHLRGTRRVGVSMEDVELVQQCIEMVAEFAQVPLNRVPRVADIEHEIQLVDVIEDLNSPDCLRVEILRPYWLDKLLCGP